MKSVLVTSSGNPNRGSWVVRGVQLGKAIGARVKMEAEREDIRKADLVILVKKASPVLAAKLRGTNLVYDVVDAWPQPFGNQWPRGIAIDWMTQHIIGLKPVGVVYPTFAMQDDIRDHGWISTVLYHHGREQPINPIRETVHVVGYEGSERYLEGWDSFILEECGKRGWRFQINPQYLAEVDILISVRGGKWRGYTTDNWKSNIKITNAHITGTPIIALAEAGAREVSSSAELWIDSPEDLPKAFDELVPQATRRQISRRMTGQAIRLEDVAFLYRNWLEAL